ncbi:competence type IV pilus minor pilin ComGG [Streptococcus moroccensis]|uniref:Late competence protein ComGG n=1 Tax=Streptococcus moroccensis TaxID=1451356 RepID=A0ABT9YV14_9STRE|nr:competence type IV pilus minor pilin ComGG [Streptococcus moroccensis]MDQ0222935.1 hypothetical protein [Streptococcus moroccensis]
MPWKKTVRAGILLYALLMLALFSLLLQFYLNRQVMLAQTNQANTHSLTAYAMAQWTKEAVEQDLESKAIVADEPDIERIEDAQTTDQESKADQDSRDESIATLEPIEGQAHSEPVAQEREEPLSEKVANTPKVNHDEESLSKGQLYFDKGEARYQLEDGQLKVDVQLTGGQVFQYQFPINSENH